MKGPLLTQVEKSSSDPRWEESMNLQLQADPSFSTHPSHTGPQGCVASVLTASSHVGGPRLAGRLLRAPSCQPHGTLLAEVLAASTETKPNPAVLAILQEERVAVPGEWDHLVMEATHWNTQADPTVGTPPCQRNLLSQYLPGNQRT